MQNKMSDEINKPYLRRMLRTLGVMGLVILLVIRLFIMPLIFPNSSISAELIINQLIDSLLVALLASLIVAEIVLRYSIPKSEHKSIESINPLSINSLAKLCCATSNKWCYRGHTGTFVRTVILPELAKSAKSKKIRKEVYFVILDPQNERALTEFIRYRNATVKHPMREVSVDSLKIKIISTILAAVAYNNASPLHSARIYLNDRYSAIRLDLCDDYAFVTTEDPGEPAIQVKGNSSFWNALFRDFTLDCERLSEVVIPQSILVTSLEKKEDAKAMVGQLGINLVFSDSKWDQVLHEINYGKNPFAI